MAKAKLSANYDSKDQPVRYIDIGIPINFQNFKF